MSTNLEDITFDKLETDIMSVLYTNMDIEFSQYNLFTKLLNDKYDGQYSYIHPSFKSKFLLILRNLMSKYDDIQVTKEANDTYFVVCTSESNAHITIIKNSYTDDLLKKSDWSETYDYIYDNNMEEYINFVDPFEANTIYHNLVLCQNIKQIQRLIDTDSFNYFIKNKNGKTPIELSESQQITSILSIGLINKYLIVTERLNLQHNSNIEKIAKYDVKVSYLESKEYRKSIIEDTNILNILFVKLYKTYTDNKIVIFIIFILLFLLKSL